MIANSLQFLLDVANNHRRFSVKVGWTVPWSEQCKPTGSYVTPNNIIYNEAKQQKCEKNPVKTFLHHQAMGWPCQLDELSFCKEACMFFSKCSPESFWKCFQNQVSSSALIVLKDLMFKGKR